MRRILPTLLLLSAAPALAAPGGGSSCLAIADPAQRLACYDAAFERPGAPADPLPPRNPEVDFGRPPQTPPDTKQISEISSTITTVSADAAGQLKLYLANDQAWVIKGFDRPIPPRDGTQVTIARGLLFDNYLIELPTGEYQARRVR